ncbi:hypothetical protein P4E94_10930 [Pontiellaceae bacterium B12219]|nr:hypothetical protein [Pontiellaceae bacterium B12219]
MMKRLILFSGAALLLAGCTTSEPSEPVIDPDATMEVLEAGLRPEVLLFPDYLMLADFQLFQHGRIIETEWVGAGMRSYLSLSNIRNRLLDVLDSKGWSIQRTEIEQQSFRVLAEHGAEHVEIRCVQGSGPTEIFILYRPDPAAQPVF